jgi:general secretion pathway protein M
MSAPRAWPGAARAAWHDRWQALAPRERRAVAAAAAVLAAYALWAFAVQPAWRTVRTAPAQLAALDAEWQAMQRLATEARSLRALKLAGRA